MQRRSVLFLETGKQKSVQVLPYLFFEHIAVNLLIPYAPALLSDTPADHFHLKPVVLDIHARCQHQHPVRHIRIVNLSAVQQHSVLHLLAPLLPGLAQLRVHPNFHALRVSLVKLFFCHKELLDDLFPGAEGGCQRIQVETSGLRRRIFCHEPPPLARLLPLIFPGYHPAPLTLVQHLSLRVLPVKDHIGPHERLGMPAIRARHIPFLFRDLLELCFDAALPFDNWRADDHGFLVPKGRLPLLCQAQRVALCSGAGRIAVNLVRQQNLDRAAGKARGAVCAYDGDVPAGEIFLHDGVAAVPALNIHLVPQLRRVPYHRGQPVFGKSLSHVKRRLHHQDRGRGVIHVVPQRVQDKRIGLSDLRGTHNDYLADMRVSDGVHDLPLIWGLVRVPAARLCAALRRQHPVFVRPL